jgi:hypothetical protein
MMLYRSRHAAGRFGYTRDIVLTCGFGPPPLKNSQPRLGPGPVARLLIAAMLICAPRGSL